MEKRENEKDKTEIYTTESNNGFTGELIFHNDKLKQIQKLKSTLKTEEVFKIPKILGFLRRKNEIIYCVTTKELSIDMFDTKGDVYLPLITKQELNKKLISLTTEVRQKMTTVHWGAVKIILTAHFPNGINTPIKMALIDNRINDRKHSVIGAAKGNLAYGKFMFSVYPKYRINLKTLNLDKTLSFVHELENKDLMNNGDKVFSVTYWVAYAISNSVHSIEYTKQEYIELDEVFSDIGNIEKNEFCELFPEEEDNWTIDLTKNKRYYGQPRSKYEPGRSSDASCSEPRNDLRQLSYKMDKIGKAIGFTEWQKKK